LAVCSASFNAGVLDDELAHSAPASPCLEFASSDRQKNHETAIATTQRCDTEKLSSEHLTGDKHSGSDFYHKAERSSSRHGEDQRLENSISSTTSMPFWPLPVNHLMQVCSTTSLPKYYLHLPALRGPWKEEINQNPEIKCK